MHPHVAGLTRHIRATQTQMKDSVALWQRSLGAQVVTAINLKPVTAAAPLPELQLVYYVRQHVSVDVEDVAGSHSTSLAYHQLSES